LKAALDGAWGVFSVQNTWEAGVEKEEEQGKRLAKLAREAGVQHFVYTSVGSAERNTGIPHFDNKWRVEETVRGLDFPGHVIIRPVFFMENLPSPWFLNGDKLVTALKPETKLQMVAVDDIGRVGAQAFIDAEKLNRCEIEIAGDAVTMSEAAKTVGEAMGKNLEFMQIPIDEIRKNSEDFALMLEWFDNVGYGADIPKLDAEFGHMQRLNEWAANALKA
ncbi:MAG: NmrA family NAD(P)-binding protein, partial [Planctomycetes bacterium]|nr:NmrA family NAD(P)-binding protein [Planctomycetota bacterium]